MIPKQFKELKFIKIKKESKEPISIGDWNNNYFNYEEAEKVINEGFNIGIIAGKQYNNKYLIIIDVDKLELEDYLKNNLPSTLIEKTCNNGRHYFYFLNEIKNIKNCIIGERLGELRVDRQYAVVTPSKAVNKEGVLNDYIIINNTNISEINEDVLINLINFFNKKSIGERKFFVKKEYSEEEVKNFVNRIENKFIKNLILTEIPREEIKKYGFNSRSERDEKIICYLLNINKYDYIYSIFKHMPCGNKFREHPSPDKYLEYSINSAANYLKLRTPEELYLELDIERGNIKFIKRDLDKYLLKIREVSNDNLFRDLLLSTLAFRLKINKNILLNRMSDLFENDIVLNLDSIYKIKIEKKEYYLKPVIPKNSLIMIASKPGNGKSLISLGLINSLVLKKDFIGFKNDCEEEVKALYYSVDDNNIETLSEREKYILNGLNVSDEEINKIKDSIYFKFNFNLSNLEKEIEFCKKFNIIILDSYRRILGSDENDSFVTNEFYNKFLRKLKEMKKTIIILHHLKKGDLESFDEFSLIDSIRGSSDIVSQMDLIYLLKSSNINKNESDYSEVDLYIDIVKNRIGLHLNNFNFKVIKDDRLADENNNLNKQKTIFYRDSSNTYTTPKEKRQAVIRNIIQTKREINRKDLINEIINKFNVSKHIIIKDLEELVRIGEIKKSKLGVYSIN